VIRIGRGYSGDRQTREGTSVPQKDLKLPQKAELFQTVPARVFSPPCCVLSPLILTHSAWMSTHPAVETGAPNWKIHPKKGYWSRSLFIIFAPPQKKRFTHLQLNSPTKALFPSNVIVDLWSCKSSFNPEGLAFFNRYVLLVYFTRIPRYMIYLKTSPGSTKALYIPL